MLFNAVFENFCRDTPFAPMLRATFERLLSPRRLDAIFDQVAVDQYTRQLTFSAIVDLLADVVLRVRPSVRKAYQGAPLPATLRAVYDKLAHVETATSQALVEQLAADARDVLDAMPGALRPDPVPGLRLRTIDGNYLAGTEHRLKALRGRGAAALPGMSVVLRDDRTGLLDRVALCEDGHANERALTGTILSWVREDDLFLADRNYCTAALLAGVADRGGYFLVRHHKGLPLKALGEREAVGRTATGAVYEYPVQVGDAAAPRRLRCIEVALDAPTRDGETTLRLLSNVPADRASALGLADLYHRRWRLETSFQELTVLLKCEVDTLAYPKAALFGFALALVAYDVLAVLQGAVAAAFGREKLERELSVDAMVEEIKSTTRGMGVALPDAFWEGFATMGAQAFADWLVKTAGRLEWSRYKKSERGPKKPVAKKKAGRGGHLSTAKLLLERKGK